MPENKSKPCDTTCPKCGAGDVRLQHCYVGMVLDAFKRRVILRGQFDKYQDYLAQDGANYAVVKEHLQCNCALCHFEWRIPVL